MKSLRIILITVLGFLVLQNPAFSQSPIDYLEYIFEVSNELTDHRTSANSVTFNSDGDVIASGSSDSTVKLWEAESGKRIKAIMRHPFSILCVAFSPDDNVLAAGSEDGTITLWDVNYKERIKTLRGHEDSVWSVRFSPDGLLLASGSADNRIIIWDMKSGKELRELAGHKGAINTLAFSPDGALLSSGSTDGTVKIWDPGSGNNESTFQDEAGAIDSVCFSPDSGLLASGAVDGSIKIWNVDSGTEARSLSGHMSAIGINDCMSFSPDGRILVSGSADASILVWDVASGNKIKELNEHRSAVNAIVFSPDGRLMASAGADGVVKLWKITIKEILEITLVADYSGWQRGILQLSAQVVGRPDEVIFQYSLDGSTWLDIVEKREPPYSVDWNTAPSIPGLAESVYLRVLARRSTGATAIDVAPGNFQIDNQPPKTEHNYDGEWHKEDFSIELSADDGTGVGVEDIGYRLNYGQVKSLRWNGQPQITTEGLNVLEYWSVDRLGNEEVHKTLNEVKLDKTPPAFFSWSNEPDSLVEEATGAFRVSVQITDEGGSGLGDIVPRFDYYIGLDSSYDGYENMSEVGDGVWYYDIPEPLEGWDNYKGKGIYYRAICEDVAGNASQSAERQEIIGSSKNPPVVKIEGEFRKWESGVLKLEADASDSDGAVKNVLFEYSLDNMSWTKIGERSASPYAVEWDTTADIPEVEKNVWLRVTATDTDGLSARYIEPKFGIDNQPPTTTHDYDGKWHKNNFTINLIAIDTGGGISATKYILNGGRERDTKSDGQPEIERQGSNTLEYWSIDVSGNAEARKTLTDVKLDRLAPFFKSWDVEQDGNLLRITLELSDPDSGIKDAPQIACRIGSDGDYSEYEAMRNAEDDLWTYAVEASEEDGGKMIACKVNVRDAVGNLAIKPWEYTIASTTGSVTAEVIDESTPEEVSETDISVIEEKPETVSTPVVESDSRKKSTIVWDVQSSGEVNVGGSVDVRGYLKPKMGKAVPLTATVIAPGDDIYTSQIDTDTDGMFRLSLSLTTGGEWRVLVDWKGDSEYQPAKSKILIFQAIASEEVASEVKSKAKESASKAGGFLKKNSIIIGLIFLYVIAIRLYRN